MKRNSTRTTSRKRSSSSNGRSPRIRRPTLRTKKRAASSRRRWPEATSWRRPKATCSRSWITAR
ncbi:hypothetical protein SD70_01645 [Gordoniibacillus kamchatkensis]|uniref:Uncharacterized protein n=1 Tax=Gordoniibacillus kamchatkensis TaxID=1590651 RepID=A0ABR5AP00_9BACL|nr:hypothetical protein SD70_01645 [Paenibacillus sp. VKM B-2647]